MRIRNGPDDVIDTAAPSRELGGDAAGPHFIVGPDAATESEVVFVGKCNRFSLVSERSYTEYGAEGLFGKNTGLCGNVSEERRLISDSDTILWPVQRGPAGKCIFDLFTKIGLRIRR
jgi:hypothetical protein